MCDARPGFGFLHSHEGKFSVKLEIFQDTEMSACGKKGSKKEPCYKVIRKFSYACPKNVIFYQMQNPVYTSTHAPRRQTKPLTSLNTVASHYRKKFIQVRTVIQQKAFLIPSSRRLQEATFSTDMRIGWPPYSN